MFEDKTLTCKECGEDFVFTAGEQEFYQEKGFENTPSRCPSCRAARKQRVQRSNNSGYGSQRKMYKVICADCGVETEVPFEPTGDRPVYCRDCFRNTRQRSYSY